MTTQTNVEPDRLPYERPAVTFESELEVRAGSPLGLPDLFDPLATDKP